MKIETCFICKLGIDIEKEDYCKISDYKKGKHFKSIYCHPACWREHMGNKELLKKTLGMAGIMAQKVNQMMEVR